MDVRQELKRVIELKLQGMKLLEADHRREMQKRSEEIKALKIRLREYDDKTQANSVHAL